MRDQEQVRASGGCLCGRVRYTVRGPLRRILLCHCGQCRRVHSHLGAYSSAARADIDLEGAGAIVWFASSERGRRGFCGTSLFFQPPDEDRLAIAAGSLDQPSGLQVIGHEYVANKADYVRIDDGLPARAGDWQPDQHPLPADPAASVPFDRQTAVDRPRSPDPRACAVERDLGNGG